MQKLVFYINLFGKFAFGIILYIQATPSRKKLASLWTKINLAVVSFQNKETNGSCESDTNLFFALQVGKLLLKSKMNEKEERERNGGGEDKS